MASITRRNSILALFALFITILIYLFNGSSGLAPSEGIPVCDTTRSPQIKAHCKFLAEAPMAALKGKNLRVMCIGDSVTAGAMGTNSYRKNLIKGLHGNTIDMVGSTNWGTMQPAELNRFEGGMSKTVEDLTALLPKPLSKWRPNVILLHAGTNDVAWKKELETAPQRMQVLVDMILDACPRAVVLVALITPVSFRNAEIRNFNLALAQIVADRAATGAHILTADMWSAFEAPGHTPYMEDVAHPNADGFVKMAEIWLETLQKANGLGWIEEPAVLER